MIRIGIFDSGMGGLTVLRQIHARMPGHATIYLGDTARVPYGIRSAETVTRYALENTSFLHDQGIDALVVACNTATAVALDAIRDAMGDLPVLGVVEPGAARAAQASASGRIVVLATEATIASGAYERAIQAHRADAQVIGRACPLFVPLAEEGWTANDVAQRTAERYLADIGEAGVDTAVLGCTHYPLLAETIAAVLGTSIEIVDSAQSTADALSDLVPTTRYNKAGERKYFVTDAPERFTRVGERFLGSSLAHVEHVDLPRLAGGG